jgi:hypothetical protein
MEGGSQEQSTQSGKVATCFFYGGISICFSKYMYRISLTKLRSEIEVREKKKEYNEKHLLC